MNVASEKDLKTMFEAGIFMGYEGRMSSKNACYTNVLRYKTRIILLISIISMVLYSFFFFFFFFSFLFFFFFPQFYVPFNIISAHMRRANQ